MTFQPGKTMQQNFGVNQIVLFVLTHSNKDFKYNVYNLTPLLILRCYSKSVNLKYWQNSNAALRNLDSSINKLNWQLFMEPTLYFDSCLLSSFIHTEKLRLMCLPVLDLRFYYVVYRLLDSLVVECWLRVWEVPGSIPRKPSDRVLASSVGGPGFNPQSRTVSYQRHYKNGTSSFLVQHSTFERENTGSFSRIKIGQTNVMDKIWDRNPSKSYSSY